MGSLAGEPWRLKQALADPTKAFELCPAPARGSWWQRFEKTQTYDDFKSRLVRSQSTTRTIDVILVGDAKAVRERVNFPTVLTHLEAFTGYTVALRPVEVGLGDWACPRLGADDIDQVAAHLVLGQLEDMTDPRSVCTIGLTATDLYLPKGNHNHVAGASDSQLRVGVFSIARKLHWLSQVDLLDRYAHLPRVLNEWFSEEVHWLKQRMLQVGMPTYGSLQTPRLPEPDPGKFF